MGAPHADEDGPHDSPEADHYFTAEPTSLAQHRRVQVHLAGRDLQLSTAAGVFSPSRLDKGTAVLLDEVPPPPPTGRFLDLGCGWGPLALTLGLRSPEAEVIAVDVNRRALDLLQHNCSRLGLTRVQPLEPHQVPEPNRFDLIWSNPPIRIGKPALHDLLRTWLPRLSPDGIAWLVVQRNLGADSLLRWLQQEFEGELVSTRYASHAGFRVLRVARDSEARDGEGRDSEGRD